MDGTVMTSKSVNDLTGKDKAFMDFIQDSITLLLRFENSFLVCQRQGLPPICLLRCEDGVWIALMSEFEDLGRRNTGMI